MIVLAPVVSVAWCEIVIQRSGVIYLGISHLSLVTFVIWLSHKDWVLPNSRIWLAEIEEWSSAHHLSQAKCQLVQTSCVKRIKLFLFGHIINILITELSRSVWKNLDLSRVYRPHCVRSVLTTSVKILPYRSPARLIRAKAYTRVLNVCIYLENVGQEISHSDWVILVCRYRLWKLRQKCNRRSLTTFFHWTIPRYISCVASHSWSPSVPRPVGFRWRSHELGLPSLVGSKLKFSISFLLKRESD